jgi:peptidoglycan hydrolase CwlO-like protein
MEYTPIITSISAIVAVVISVLSFTRNGKKDQTELDKEQTEKISELQQTDNRHEERIQSMKERMDRIDARQDVHENKTELAIAGLTKKIDDMPQKIVDLIKGIGK